MKHNITELVFILDRSGSMAGLEGDTIGGFNGMLEKQRREAGECRITTVLFDHRYEVVHASLPIAQVPPMDAKTYYMRGSTALLDAVGYTIERIIDAQRKATPSLRADNVLFVIITDGYENASRMFTRAEVQRMIRHEREQYGWEFLFLGANIDAEETAEGLGIARERAVNYRADSVGTARNFEAVSVAATCVRANRAMDGTWRRGIDEDFRKRKGGRR